MTSAPLPFTALDPNNKAAAVTVSNDNLTVTTAGTGNDQLIRSLGSVSSGRWYYEILIGNTSCGWGFCNSSQTFNSGDYAGDANQNSVGFYNTTGTTSTFWINNNFVATPVFGPRLLGEIWAIAVDVPNHLLWVRQNNRLWNEDPTANPTSGTAGFDYSSGAPGLVGTSLFAVIDADNAGGPPPGLTTVNFGGTSFSFAVPAGFGPTPNLPPASVGISNRGSAILVPISLHFDS